MIKCMNCGDLGYVVQEHEPVPCPQCSKSTGRKFDGDKPDYSLLPFDAIKPVVQVLTVGAKKYEPDNWRRVKNANQRYVAAALRHVAAYQCGEINDDETGLPHIAHAVCCLLFILGKKDHEKDDSGRIDEPHGQPAEQQKADPDEGRGWGARYWTQPPIALLREGRRSTYYIPDEEQL